MDTEQTYKKAVKILKNNCIKDGFLASNIDEKKFKRGSKYKRVWSRDGVVQGLASIMVEDKELIKTFKKNLETLKRYQDKTGRIASNINTKNEDISYGTLVGKIDATLWYIIGIGQYYKYSKDKEFLKEFIDSVKKAIFYLEAIELNGKDLLYIPAGGDWADEYITHGYILFDQILYLQALKDYKFIKKELKEESQEIEKKIKRLRRKINVNYLPTKKKLENNHIFHERLYERILSEFETNFALSYFSSDGFSHFMDCFANSLLLLTKVPSKKEKEKIIKSLSNRLSKQDIKILPAFWPPITPDNEWWDELKTNSPFQFQNKPYYYHNGGLWPLIQGFFIAALNEQGKEEKAKQLLKQFSKVLKQSDYKFHEYYESKNYKPEGITKMGFSASGYILAYLSITKNKKVFT